MLVLTRKIGEGITIGNDIRVVVLEVKGGQVRLGIEAPPTVRVHRDEVYLKILRENQQAAASVHVLPLEALRTIGKKVDSR